MDATMAVLRRQRQGVRLAQLAREHRIEQARAVVLGPHVDAELLELGQRRLVDRLARVLAVVELDDYALAPPRHTQVAESRHRHRARSPLVLASARVIWERSCLVVERR